MVFFCAKLSKENLCHKNSIPEKYNMYFRYKKKKTPLRYGISRSKAGNEVELV